jgi:membrane protein implicated in regulation of membrane protease activity
MKLPEVVLLSFGIAIFFMGVHQAMLHGIKNSYWIFMISLSFILFLRYRLAVKQAEQPNENTTKSTKEKSKKPKK